MPLRHTVLGLGYMDDIVVLRGCNVLIFEAPF